MPIKKCESLNLWDLAQGHLCKALDEHSYKNWFSQTKFRSFNAGCLEVDVPSQFFADWLRDHYLDTIMESVGEVADDLKEVLFIPAGENSLPANDAAFVAKGISDDKLSIRPKQKFNGFNSRYTFNRFVVGAGNRFAHAAAKAVADAPSRAYNPLFLYGGTGLGKTHLMQAVGHEILVRDPKANVMFVSSEQFTNQLIESIAKKSTQRFRNKYRKADVLLIDDIHFIAGKEATQEEFFHTFNTLSDMHKQIVLSSDRGPKDIQGLEERLVSRFEWGLVTDVQPPDLETRVAILQNRAMEENLVVSQDVMKFIATYITSNIRELEGALVTVIAYSKLTGQDITIATAEDVLRDLIGTNTIKPLTIESIQRAVAEHFDVRIADLRGRSRQRQVAFPRQAAMYLCKELIPSLSLNDIGDSFGGKDHTTVIYSCRKIRKDAKKERTVRQTLAQLEKAIRDQ